MNYIKIFTDMRPFFEDECMSYEDTGKLLIACFDYTETGDAHIEDLFAPGTMGRMAWKAIKRMLDANAAKSTINAANASSQADQASDAGADPAQSRKTPVSGQRQTKTAANENEQKPTETNKSETERTEANKSEQKRTGAKQSEAERTKANENENERSEANRSEAKRSRAKQSEAERTGANESEAKRTEAKPSDPCIQEQEQEHIQEQEQYQEQQQEYARAREQAHAQAQPQAHASAAKSNKNYEPAAADNLIDLQAWETARTAAISAGIIVGKHDSRDFAAACQHQAADCNPQWAMAAVAQAVKQQHATWAYFAAILRGYQTSGGIDSLDGGRAGQEGSRGTGTTGAKQVTEQCYEQRPNDYPDGDAIPSFLRDIAPELFETAGAGKEGVA